MYFKINKFRLGSVVFLCLGSLIAYFKNNRSSSSNSNKDVDNVHNSTQFLSLRNWGNIFLGLTEPKDVSRFLSKLHVMFFTDKTKEMHSTDLARDSIQIIVLGQSALTRNIAVLNLKCLIKSSRLF